jgi:hypothetical protein
VTLEDVVVDDHDISERIEVVAVSVNNRRDAVRDPSVDLALPVALDNVGNDNEEGE